MTILKQGSGFTAGQSAPVRHTRHHMNGLLQFFEPFGVHCIALQEMIPQDLRRPDAKLRAAFGIHAIADGDDNIQVVILGLVCLTVFRSMCKKCTY